jgi:hypothetical protein
MTHSFYISHLRLTGSTFYACKDTSYICTDVMGEESKSSPTSQAPPYVTFKQYIYIFAVYNKNESNQ